MDMDKIEQMIVDKGKVNNRITPADIEACIDGEYYFTAGQGVHAALCEQDEITRQTGMHNELNLLTFCVLRLKNGFTVTGESACADADNFDEGIGRTIAKRKALEKIWPLLGYELRTRLSTQK